MTAADMLNRLGVLLDEDITLSEFWTPTQAYAALSDGQNEVIKQSYAKYATALQQSAQVELPIVLRPLLTLSTLTAQNGTNITLPSTLYEILSLKIDIVNSGRYVPAFRRAQNPFKYYYIDNPYLQSSGSNTYNTDIFYDIIPPNIVFETALANANVVTNFIAKPSDLSVTQDATIDSLGHEAVVYYAWFQLLSKAKLPLADALTQFQKLMDVL